MTFPYPFSLSCKICFQKLLFWYDLLNLETVEKKGKRSNKKLNISGTTTIHDF